METEHIILRSHWEYTVKPFVENNRVILESVADVRETLWRTTSSA
jgi:hypothetical protein